MAVGALTIFSAMALTGCGDNKKAANGPDELKKLGKIRVAVFSDKIPFGYVDKNGVNRGYDVYFAERIGKDLGVKINYGVVSKESVVDNAYFLVRPWSIEESLDNILTPAGYTFRYDKMNNEYVVLKELNMYVQPVDEGRAMLEYLSSLYADKSAWELRKDSLRKSIRHNIGLDKLPEHFTGNVYLGKKRVYGDYYVQNIGLEILPGVYCTGSIYHPVKFKKGKCPIIINPHGHYPSGRYTDLIQIRCAMQARLGCVAIVYDMFAWGEQPMFPKECHSTSLSQPIQVLSALRLLDYALALPEADKTRVAVTGSSGGGSQTMFTCAIDDRVTLSMPVVMMSSYFHGGCKCESGTNIHLSGSGTNNVEIASLFAPKPMLIVSDGDDWTQHTPDVDFPFVKRIYGFYDAQDNVENAHFADEVHDYGPSKRQATYRFLEKHWQLNTSKLKDASGNFDESKCVVEDYDLLKVWGPNGENWPKDAVRDLDTLAKLLHWSR